MVDSLTRICKTLGADISQLNNYNDDCAKSQYLVNQIAELLGA